MRPLYTLDDLTPHRIRVAYRIVRALAAATRAIRPDETLEDATRIVTLGSSTGSVWTAPRPLPENLPLAESINTDMNSEETDPRHRQLLAAVRENHEGFQPFTITLIHPRFRIGGSSKAHRN